MKLKWFGQSAFALTSQKGTVVITDPYQAGGFNGALNYPKITLSPDIVTVSHQHADHNDTKSLPGRPRIFDKAGAYEHAGIKITGIPSLHDQAGGKERGPNLIFRYEIDGLRIAHLGDLGQRLSEEQIKVIGQVDVLLIPVGGYFTIDAARAHQVASQLSPSVIIPMHYKTEKVDFPITGVEVFLKGQSNVRKFTAPEVVVEKDSLPAQPEIWVLPYAP